MSELIVLLVCAVAAMLIAVTQIPASKVEAAYINRQLLSTLTPPNPSRPLPPTEFVARIDHASALVDANLRNEIPANANVVSEAKRNLQKMLSAEETSLPTYDREQAISLLVRLQAYELFSERAKIAPSGSDVAYRAVFLRLLPQVYMPPGQHLLNGVPIENRLGPVWLRGAGQNSTYIVIGPTHSGTYVFSNSEDAPMVLSDFTVLNEAPAPSSVAFLRFSERKSTALVRDVTLNGVTQDLGNVTWLNVTFVNSTISYSGGFLALGTVTFHNCTFEDFHPNPDGARLRATIRAKPDAAVTFYSSGP